MSDQIIRWLSISAYKHFKENIELFQLFEKPPNDQSFWGEFRIDGPNEEEPSCGVKLITLHIDLLLTSDANEDLYRLYRMLDAAKNAFQPICCFRYGDGEFDDQTSIGTLIQKGTIDVVNWGFIDSSSEFHRASISSDYYLQLP